MPDNWFALFVAIINPELSVDKALVRMGIGQSQYKKYKRKTQWNHVAITDEDIEEMIRMRGKDITYKEIGKYFDISDKTVYVKIKRYKQKVIAA